MSRIVVLLATALLAGGTIHAQSHGAQESDAARRDHATCPMHASHSGTGADDRLHGVNARGDRVMGFSHATTRHRFVLTPRGGVIEVTVTDPADLAARDRIRAHLSEIAGAFSSGDFAMPKAIHAMEVPGSPAMARLRSEIRYEYEPLERGGRVRIVTGNSEALAAVHAFLQFQIEDHQTGDSLDVTHE